MVPISIPQCRESASTLHYPHWTFVYLGGNIHLSYKVLQGRLHLKLSEDSIVLMPSFSYPKIHNENCSTHCESRVLQSAATLMIRSDQKRKAICYPL